ncbi:hypothetical protein SAMD00019534_075760 [Acytostelium subglobosum LB1]|uniref:hypothetical protein n=1 Tax=Acytostelium subglobosum LB1 TaxID=1410327 RepID=UPI000645200A|nr:hypothetical protein SAMD00019534_075760 [Acytostelium subglobosum LB1]GAM24401.1 hypothetical protein SAMD00019534_075760 [Acytostelium subglobosum LB1]|eukprot:XP_012752727.1 hypothetical protein SAMD00019534_075760 [Acytostelium subglobosum LB1]
MSNRWDLDQTHSKHLLRLVIEREMTLHDHTKGSFTIGQSFSIKLLSAMLSIVPKECLISIHLINTTVLPNNGKSDLPHMSTAVSYICQIISTQTCLPEVLRYYIKQCYLLNQGTSRGGKAMIRDLVAQVIFGYYIPNCLDKFKSLINHNWNMDKFIKTMITYVTVPKKIPFNLEEKYGLEAKLDMFCAGLLPVDDASTMPDYSPNNNNNTDIELRSMINNKELMYLMNALHVRPQDTHANAEVEPLRLATSLLITHGTIPKDLYFNVSSDPYKADNQSGRSTTTSNNNNNNNNKNNKNNAKNNNNGLPSTCSSPEFIECERLLLGLFKLISSAQQAPMCFLASTTTWREFVHYYKGLNDHIAAHSNAINEALDQLAVKTAGDGNDYGALLSLSIMTKIHETLDICSNVQSLVRCHKSQMDKYEKMVTNNLLTILFNDQDYNTTMNGFDHGYEEILKNTPCQCSVDYLVGFAEYPGACDPCSKMRKLTEDLQSFCLERMKDLVENKKYAYMANDSIRTVVKARFNRIFFSIPKQECRVHFLQLTNISETQAEQFLFKNVKRNLIPEDRWQHAVDLLRKLPKYTDPLDMLKCILQFKDVLGSVYLHKYGDFGGTDTVLPVTLYLVHRAGVPNFMSIIQLIRIFIDLDNVLDKDSTRTQFNIFASNLYHAPDILTEQ